MDPFLYTAQLVFAYTHIHTESIDMNMPTHFTQASPSGLRLPQLTVQVSSLGHKQGKAKPTTTLTWHLYRTALGEDSAPQLYPPQPTPLGVTKRRTLMSLMTVETRKGGSHTELEDFSSGQKDERSMVWPCFPNTCVMFFA